MPMDDNQIKRAIRPTLFIGLGGTGKEVLLRLRRKFYERFGQSGLDCTAYLWMDTDTKDTMAQGEAVDDIYNAVSFQAHEKIALLEGTVGDDLSEIFVNKGRWDYLHRWLYEEVERYGTEITDGAGGVRSVGRLTFFHGFGDKIIARVSEALTNVGTFDALNKTETFFLERKLKEKVQIPDTPTPQVVLISSLAGGTGCGTFLDVVFFLKYLSQQRGIPIERIVGMLFMPNVFYATAQGEVAQRSYGNAYAALKELEFYTLRLQRTGGNQQDRDKDLSIDYNVEWEAGRMKRIQGPPFSVAYIEEMRNEAQTSLHPKDRSEMFAMAAESLFLDFVPGPFPDAKRSHYSNVAQSLSGQQGHNIISGGVVLPQTFARRYASFGMSKIEIPIDTLKGACSARLAYEIAAYIKRDNTDPDIRPHVLHEMAAERVDEGGLLDRFGEIWKERIRSAVDEMFRGLTIKEASHVDGLEKRLAEFEVKYLQAEGNDPTKWGETIDYIRKSTGNVTREANEALLNWMKGVMENEARGLKLLLAEDGYLVYLTENIKGLYAPPGAVYDSRKEAAKRDADARKKQKEATLKELRVAVTSHMIAGLRSREWTIQKLCERLQNAETQYALARAEDCLLDEAKKVARSADEFVADKRPRMEKFLGRIGPIAQAYDAMFESFLNFGQQVLFIRFFDRERDWDKFYKLDLDDGNQPKVVNPKAEYQQFMRQNFDGNATLWELVSLFGQRSEKEVKQKMMTYAEDRFRSDFESHPREVNVLQHPKMTELWNESIDRMVRSAIPMLRRKNIVGQPEPQKIAYLGVCETKGGDYENFIEKTKQQLLSKGYTLTEALPTGKPWEVYLYLVCYAFPLPSLPVVNADCHDAYDNFYQALRDNRITGKQWHQIPLHLSKAWEGRFEDLRVLSDDEALQVKQGREVLLFGAILRVLTMKESQGHIEYGYKRGRPLFTIDWFRSKREAADWLRNDARLCKQLLGEIAQREGALTAESLQTYYWVLQYLRFSGEFATGSPEYTLLNNRLDEVDRRLADSGIHQDALALDPNLTDEENARKALGNAGNSVESVGPFLVFKEAERVDEARS